jgi:hypothetical protein
MTWRVSLSGVLRLVGRLRTPHPPAPPTGLRAVSPDPCVRCKHVGWHYPTCPLIGSEPDCPHPPADRRRPPHDAPDHDHQEDTLTIAQDSPGLAALGRAPDAGQGGRAQ